MLGQVAQIDIYVPQGDTWIRWNDVSPVYARMCHNTLSVKLETVSAAQRADALAARRLQYPADVDMPDNARVYWLNDPTAEGDVSIWSVEEGTESAWYGVNGRVVVNTCQVTRISNVG